MSEVIDFLDRHADAIDIVVTNFPGERHLPEDTMLLVELLADQQRYARKTGSQMRWQDYVRVYNEYDAKCRALNKKPVSSDIVCITLKRPTPPPPFVG